ncbi:MAG: hypothetical protein MZV64_14180 [Ignavibacteriales bacterium]|nr:hypothetical protein [Ignavibacteriales bacterium]
MNKFRFISPFKAPETKPVVNHLRIKMNNIIDGIVAITLAAASGPVLACPSIPVYRANSTCRVASAGLFIRTKAKKNSFHAEMNANSAEAPMAGKSKGSIIF